MSLPSRRDGGNGPARHARRTSGARQPDPARLPLRRAIFGIRPSAADRFFAQACARADARQAQREEGLRRLRARIQEQGQRVVDCAQALEAQRKYLRDTEAALAEYEAEARREADEARRRFEEAEARLLARLEQARSLLDARWALLRSAVHGLFSQTEAIAARVHAERIGVDADPAVAVPPPEPDSPPSAGSEPEPRTTIPLRRDA